MARALRWGVMSAGLISHDFVTALRSLPRSEHQVVAVAARDLGRAQDFARRHDIPKAYGSYEDLLRKEPDVGVDDTVTVALQYPSGLQASFSSSITTVLPNSLHVFGTQGQAQIPSTMWCPTELLVNGERAEFPLPAVANTETFNYPKSIGLVYEAQHVRQCLLQGLKESSVMPLAESELLADILEEARRQIGLRFSQDRT
uniref:GFO/IDH/MocA-like oxidoreductase domain-containing protein n=1 Tax=Monodelphis domestica TaxID=13616 RepID=F6XRN3_MONDO